MLYRENRENRENDVIWLLVYSNGNNMRKILFCYVPDGMKKINNKVELKTST